MLAALDGQALVQTGHEGRSEPVHVPGQAHDALLGMSAREREVLGVRELAAQRLVPALGRGDHLGVEPANLVGDAAPASISPRPSSVGSSAGTAASSAAHPLVHRVLEVVQRLFERRGQLRLEPPVQRHVRPAPAALRSSSDVRARNRRAAESRMVPVARGTISGIGVS